MSNEVWKTALEYALELKFKDIGMPFSLRQLYPDRVMELHMRSMDQDAYVERYTDCMRALSGREPSRGLVESFRQRAKSSVHLDSPGEGVALVFSEATTSNGLVVFKYFADPTAQNRSLLDSLMSLEEKEAALNEILRDINFRREGIEIWDGGDIFANQGKDENDPLHPMRVSKIYFAGDKVDEVFVRPMLLDQQVFDGITHLSKHLYALVERLGNMAVEYARINVDDLD
jgi:hypothetical protein